MHFEAIIVDYLPGDLHFDYEDGTFEWFDGVVLKIIEPELLYDDQIYVFHDPELSKENRWKKVGIVVEFEYETFNDFKSFHVFTSGLKYVGFKL